MQPAPESDAHDREQQDTATSAQAGSHLATSHREGHRTPSAQGRPDKPADGSKSHTAQCAARPVEDAVSSQSCRGSDGGSNEPGSLGVEAKASTQVAGEDDQVSSGKQGGDGSQDAALADEGAVAA